MKLTSEMVKQAAFAAGAGDVGIANIERFANAPRQMHPKNIFPDCKSVITIVQPFPRGTYRGITEGTYWANYTFYSYNRLNSLFRPKITFHTACYIEDNGFEAVPLFPGGAERPVGRRISPDRPQADVNINVRIAGVACGVGEIGWSKVFISPKFGPRVRLGTILTDAELEPTPLLEPNTFCNKCMRCARECPGGAIPKEGEKDPIEIQIEDKKYQWGDVHMGRCTLTHHGLNWKASPFLKKALPGFDLDVPNSNLSEEAAYRLSYTIGLAKWAHTHEFPTTNLVDYYRQIVDHTGYFAICGAKGCIRACADMMEGRGCIEQKGFSKKVLPKDTWELAPPSEDECGGVPEGKFPEEFNDPDENAGVWE